MEIGEVKPTAEVEYQIKAVDKDGNELLPQPLKLTVRFMGVDRAIDTIDTTRSKEEQIKIKKGDYIHETVATAIVAWDLTTKGVPIPVTDKNKKLYVPYICGSMTTDEDIVGYELIAFVMAAANFLKN